MQEYLVREIQAVYKTQGVDINDKHVEIICRQMLKKRKIKQSGDTNFLPGQVVDKFEFEDENRRVRELDPPGTEATADWLLLGITEASLQTDSFLSAASFQKTTRVLTEAAVRGKRDNLVGLKENVIIGRLIPAGTGLPRYRDLEVGVEKETGQFERLRSVSRPLTLEDVNLGDDSDLPIRERDEIRELAAPSSVALVEEDEAATSDVEEIFSTEIGEGLGSTSRPLPTVTLMGKTMSLTSPAPSKMRTKRSTRVPRGGRMLHQREVVWSRGAPIGAPLACFWAGGPAALPGARRSL